MQTSIGTFDSDSNSVEVTFEHDGVTFTRSVNACLDEEGQYDEAATAARVEAVARGVAHKIEIGVITNPRSDPAAE